MSTLDQDVQVDWETIAFKLYYSCRRAWTNWDETAGLTQDERKALILGDPESRPWELEEFDEAIN